MATLKDLFRENSYFTIRFTPLEHIKFIENYSKSKNRPLKFNLKKMSGLQPIRSVLQPTENCRRKLKD